ncbi:reverse transcriptase domain-containing protein [Pseudoxanthomonas sp.]|jgi:retron-type reverse transcriptase|uniref:reverse transcriptase domain-containing protein n=1 Tax=Pseudoxanthomonas sp. TaxID=1871049 RepID=UPI002E12A363|nr:reverse transcriptase domain-containing protein [Pseudoxanthomonas sp.]
MKLADLQKAHDYASLSYLLGLSPSLLKSHLYGNSGYSVFPIAKKSGGVRLIQAPNKRRRYIQKKFASVFNEVYRAGEFAHGFVVGRSVRSNALPHVGARTLINIDLQDFFSSITFKRVRGLLLKSPFSLQWNIANIVAQACCHEGVLPTGGITSPVLSNIILARLDKRISSLVLRLGGDYSRYADDLSMSFDRPLAQLSSLVRIDSVGNLSPGGALSEIISEEGFAINLAKLRVSQRGARKIVTGLVVNEKVSVRRDWYLKVESKVYAVEKFGWNQVAKSEYPEEPDQGIAVRMLMRRLHGKLSFLKMVRDPGDSVSADLAHRFNRLHGDARLRVPSVEIIARDDRASRGVFVVLCYVAPTKTYVMTSDQGTAFCVQSGLIITAAHVVLDGVKLFPHVYVMNERTKVLEECDVLAHCAKSDIAILRVKSGAVDFERHRFKIGVAVESGHVVTSVGYPDYAYGNHAAHQKHQVVKKFVASTVAKAQINGAIQGGLSGAPLLGQDMKVLGIVHKGILAAGGIPEMIEVGELRKLANAHSLSLE